MLHEKLIQLELILLEAVVNNEISKHKLLIYVAWIPTSE